FRFGATFFDTFTQSCPDMAGSDPQRVESKSKPFSEFPSVIDLFVLFLLVIRNHQVALKLRKFFDAFLEARMVPLPIFIRNSNDWRSYGGSFRFSQRLPEDVRRNAAKITGPLARVGFLNLRKFLSYAVDRQISQLLGHGAAAADKNLYESLTDKLVS